MTVLTETKPLTGIFKEVESVVENHKGRDNAIMSMDLADAVGLPRTRASTRKLQLVIRELRRWHYPVLLTCEKPYGYFWPSTWEEGQDCLRSMKNRIIADALTKADIKKALGLHFAEAEQIEMPLFLGEKT